MHIMKNNPDSSIVYLVQSMSPSHSILPFPYAEQLLYLIIGYYSKDNVNMSWFLKKKMASKDQRTNFKKLVCHWVVTWVSQVREGWMPKTLGLKMHQDHLHLSPYPIGVVESPCSICVCFIDKQSHYLSHMYS